VARLVPVLPLKDLVLLPGMMTRVHVIQVAGMAAIDEHLERRTPFLAVPTLGPLGVEDPRAEDMAEVGVLARVIKAVRLGDGTARVLLEGEQRVRVSGVRTNDDFVGMMAAFRPIQDFVETSDQVDLLVSRLREDLKRLVQQDSRLHTSFVRLIDIPVSPSRLADMVAGNLTLSKADLLEILAEANVDRRLRIVLRAIGRELDLKKLGAEIQKDVQDTMDKQQREYYLREHIRALQKELGEGGRRFDDAEDFEARLRAVGMPETSLEEALRELERMRRMHPDAAEYTVSRTWLEWLVAMPWTQRSDDALGSVLSVKIAPPYVVADFHASPSAGNILVLGYFAALGRMAVGDRSGPRTPLLSSVLCADPVHSGHRGPGSWLTVWGRGPGSWATVAPVGRPPSISHAGAGACMTPSSQARQAYLGREIRRRAQGHLCHAR